MGAETPDRDTDLHAGGGARVQDRAPPEPARQVTRGRHGGAGEAQYPVWLRPCTNQTASTGTSPLLVSRWGVEESNEIASPGPTR